MNQEIEKIIKEFRELKLTELTCNGDTHSVVYDRKKATDFLRTSLLSLQKAVVEKAIGKLKKIGESHSQCEGLSIGAKCGRCQVDYAAIDLAITQLNTLKDNGK